jgi:multiple sugar transport system substrate-binding protein
MRLGKTKRRWLIRGLLLSALAVLAGCAAGRTPDGEIVLAYPASTESNAIYGRALDLFRRRHPGTRVRPLPITGGDYYGKLLVLMAAREAPDVLWMGMGFGEFAARGVFLDIEDRVRAEPALSGGFVPQVVDWYRSGGRLYGFPFGIDMDFVVYNEELFDAAGVPYPVDWTVDDLVEKARRLTVDTDGDGRIDRYGYRGGLGFEPFGASLLTADLRRPNVQSPEMLRYLQFSVDLVRKWRVAPPTNFSDLDEQESMVAFQSGRVAMIYGHTWLLPDLRKRLTGKRWNICSPPRAARPAHWGSSQGFCIARDTRHPERAWELTRYLLTSDALWPLADHVVPANRRLLARMVREYGGERPALEVLRRGVEHLRADPRVPDLTELRGCYGEALERVLSGRAAPAEGMRSAARAMTEVLTRRH